MNPLELPPIPEDIIQALKACKRESIMDIFPDSDPKTFAAFDELMLGVIITGSKRRRVSIIKNVPLTKLIELTNGGKIFHCNVLGNFRGVDKLVMTDKTIIELPTFYNCMSPFAPAPVPDERITVDAYFCDTRFLIDLSRSQALY